MTVPGGALPSLPLHEVLRFEFAELSLAGADLRKVSDGRKTDFYRSVVASVGRALLKFISGVFNL